MKTKRILILIVFLFGANALGAQNDSGGALNKTPNVTDFVAAQVIAAENYSLPDLLKTQNGEIVNSVKSWQNVRRPEILELFRENIYGRTPVGRPKNLRFKIVESNTAAMSGRATQKQIEIHFSGPGGDGKINLILFVPNHVTQPVPGFVLICHRSPDNIDPTRNIKSPVMRPSVKFKFVFRSFTF